MSARDDMPASGGSADLPGAHVTITGLLRTAADSLDVDLAVSKARDPAAPSPEARQARRSAIATADAVITAVARLRASLEAASRGGAR